MKITLDVQPLYIRAVVMVSDRVVFDRRENWAMPFDDQAIEEHISDKQAFFGRLADVLTDVCRQTCLSVGAVEIMKEHPRKPEFDVSKWIEEKGYGD